LLSRQKLVIADLEKYDFNLESTEITDAIVERMNAFWHFAWHNNKELLGRKVTSEASDFFTETCLLFLKSYFKSIGSDYKILSEHSLIKSRKSVKPDISIWKSNELLGAIELKVSDGWKGKWIVPHLAERENQIKQLYPNAFFGVLSFWKFSQKTDVSEIWGKQYFALKIWEKDNHHKSTGLHIEDLLKCFWAYHADEATQLNVQSKTMFE
jgi:hypothetical protein